MLKKAFTHHHPNGSHVASSRWKSRLCVGFILVVILSVAIIFMAWSMICSLDAGNPAINNEYRLIGSSRDFNKSGLDVFTSSLHQVEIYYEVLCPDSRHFILKQFNPTFNKLRNYIKPVFIPYGKATTQISPSGDISFDCQHGNDECFGNTIHACAIKYVSDQDELVSFIGCMINNNRKPDSIAKKCANDLGIDLGPIVKCWKTKEGQLELQKYGQMTHNLRPTVSFIPTIVIDQSQQGQVEILKNFLRFMCKSILSKEEEEDASVVCSNV